ncbi:MAG: RNA 2',3'-cyclic phosphodiesterase [Melioribacteraceae bacterium]
MKIRSFIALDIPEDSLSELLKFRDQIVGSGIKAKWEQKEKLHVTLKFLGDIDQGQIGKYAELLENILTDYCAFDLSFSEFGVFKRGNEPKILWLGLKDNELLSELAEGLENRLAEFGFPADKRKFKSHITLLRFRGYEDQEKILSLTGVKLPEINFKSDSVTLYESRLLEGGSVYRSLKKIKLKN